MIKAWVSSSVLVLICGVCVSMSICLSVCVLGLPQRLPKLCELHNYFILVCVTEALLLCKMSWGETAYGVLVSCWALVPEVPPLVKCWNCKCAPPCLFLSPFSLIW